MNGKHAIPATLFLAVALVGCSGLKVQSDYDRFTNFTYLRTYAWRSYATGRGDDPSLDSPLLDRRIRNAIDAELARRGYEKVAGEEPDFQIAFYVTAAHRAEVTTNSYYAGSYLRHGYLGRGHYVHYRVPYFDTSSYVNEYVKGTLVVDIYDPKANELIWRGWAVSALDNDLRPEAIKMYVDEAVQKILERFPPS